MSQQNEVTMETILVVLWLQNCILDDFILAKNRKYNEDEERLEVSHVRFNYERIHLERQIQT